MTFFFWHNIKRSNDICFSIEKLNFWWYFDQFFNSAINQVKLRCFTNFKTAFGVFLFLPTFNTIFFFRLYLWLIISISIIFSIVIDGSVSSLMSSFFCCCRFLNNYLLWLQWDVNINWQNVYKNFKVIYYTFFLLKFYWAVD